MKNSRKALLALGFLAGGIAIAYAATPGAPAAAAPANARKLAFNRDIRPILADNCLSCHGPDSTARKGELRLDLEEGLFGERKGGKAIVKGDPKASLLWQRIVTSDEDDVMPPPASQKSLKPEQKETLKAWIEQGAPWEAHWAFIAPTRPPTPAVKNAGWVRNPIDAFVLAKLEAAGLAPAAEADRRTLIRRLSLDLIGLPPAPADVEAFVNDSSPDAYEKVVDRLLASPQYGEHRARYWLDAARYADTHGLHFDNYREMWPYREWVINAFNQNTPFDQFTIEQLAGDLLPNRTLAQQVASGFNRCNASTNEGGSIAEEVLVFYTHDRTETTTRVFLGLTANCATCHDHKFDPISQKEFYSMAAFFNNAAVNAMDGNIPFSPPVVVVPSADDQAKWAKVSGELGELRKQLEARKGEARPLFDKWAAAATADNVGASLPVADLRVHAPLGEGNGTTAKVTVDGKPRDVALLSGVTWRTGHLTPKAAAASTDGGVAAIPDAGDFDRKQPFSAAAWVKIPANATGAILARMEDAPSHRGWDLWVERGRIGTHVISKWQEDALKVVATRPVAADKWVHVAVTYDGAAKASGVKLYVDGAAQQAKVDQDTLKNTIRTPVPLKIGQRNAGQPLKGLVVQDVRVYGKSLSAGEVQQLARASKLGAIFAKAHDKRTDAEKKELFDYYLATQDEPSKTLAAKVATLEKEEADVKGRGGQTLVMQEKADKPMAFVLFRGAYDQRRDKVEPGTPKALPPFPADAPRNRLGFAQWLVRPENPLMARVTVNRFWQEIFGVGIVKTSEDFGVMGENPSNQELLDWLAVDFREGNWDVKRFVKQIVTSAAYRQSAATTPEKLQKDPENRLLSRGPRFRVDAEVLRDSALSASGLLVKKIGGPSVKPYQPPGVWEAVAMIGSNTRDYKQDTGESLYRRSLYTFWKRSAPPATMDIFNAPSRETCTVRRERTNTPLQALATMNDPQFVEAARQLAQAAIKDGGATFEARLAFMTARLIARPFRAEEAAVVRGAFDDLLAHYKATPEDAKKLLTVGESKRDEAIDAPEHAAWTMLANQLMNLDEALNK